ncbi:MAG TPA: cupin domain-containing protein [Casimicrobiaceae bacterium]|nr:cupin domain-containing protein [Casimicrobiaceae bacterium]
MSDARARLLGGQSPAAFLARHWQKEALRIPAALPGFQGPFDLAALRALALRDDVESRLVVRDGASWTVRHGPLKAADFRALPARQWTLLVQGVEQHHPACGALLQRFAFIPYARLDDVMVSYAAEGGGVGPHLDSYDVFLLQGFGRRRWRYGRQDDAAFRPHLPLKILRRFAPTEDHVLAGGDMLYLPPQWAHDGVALEPCTTYSIGFRAATAQELATAFLDFLRDEVALPGRYADPELRPTRTPGRIPGAMRRKVAAMLDGIRWNDALVGRFLGRLLSEPKPIVVFDPPPEPLSAAAFRRTVAKHGVLLDPRTRMLYDDASLHVNGESFDRAPGDEALERLADARALDASRCATLGSAQLARLHRWYIDGYLVPAP